MAATQESSKWKDNLDHILEGKPTEVAQKAKQVLKEHDYRGKKELKCELFINTMAAHFPSTMTICCVYIYSEHQLHMLYYLIVHLYH